ncbi:hypothetical protein MHI18_03610 [Peribacillus sp. FSL H8-0477]
MKIKKKRKKLDKNTIFETLGEFFVDVVLEILMLPFKLIVRGLVRFFD